MSKTNWRWPWARGSTGRTLKKSRTGEKKLIFEQIEKDKERKGRQVCRSHFSLSLSISLEIKIEDGLFPLFAISWCSRWEKQKQGISDLNSFLADVYHQKRDKGHEYLKFWLSAKGCPSLAKCPSIFKPWWMGTEGHFFPFVLKT